MAAGVLPALPTFWEMRPPASWACIDILSDLHLCEDTPRTFDAWAAHLRHTSADAVFILGDLFEVWVGDDARFGGFEARCAEVLADAAASKTVAFMAGNRDFLVGGDMLKECGVMALPDPTVVVAFGERLMLSHGDALCLADVDYMAFRQQVRSAAWQQDFLAKPLPERQAIASGIRRQSAARQALESVYADVDTAAAEALLESRDASLLLHGHTHRPGQHALAHGHRRLVLSDWSLGETPARADVIRLGAPELGMPSVTRLQSVTLRHPAA